MGAQIGPAGPVEVTDESFAAEVLESPLPVLVDFWGEWCPPCHAIAPALRELAEEFRGRAVLAKVNTDLHQRHMARLGVHGLPTLILFVGGREVERILGARPKRFYRERLESALREIGAAG
jgi:thioredoxin 1